MEDPVSSINIPNVTSSATGNPMASDMENAQIFSQQDVVAYLERKGLSGDTIKRLQIYNTTNTSNALSSGTKSCKSTHSTQSHHPHSNRRRKKSSKHSQSHQDLRLPPVKTTTTPSSQLTNINARDRSSSTMSGGAVGLGMDRSSEIQHSPRFYQEQYKEQQKSKRMRMIQNYSDAELLKLLNKKRNHRAEARRHGKLSKRRKNKRRTASLGVGVDRIKRKKNRRNTGNGNGNGNGYNGSHHRGYIEHHLLNHSSSTNDVSQRRLQRKKAEKLKQLQKYYSLKMNGEHHGAHGHSSNDDTHYESKRRSKGKKRKSHRSSQGKANLDASHGLKGINLKGITDSSQLVSVMQQILGKEKSSVIEEYYKNLYSVAGGHHGVAKQHPTKLPQIITPRNEEYQKMEQMAMLNQNQMAFEKSPDRQSQVPTLNAESVHNTATGSAGTGHEMKETSNQKVSFASTAAPAPSHYVVAATEPELIGTHFGSSIVTEFEIEDYLKPSNYDGGLGEDTMIDSLLFWNQHNINIPIFQSKESKETELNLPRFEHLTYFDGIVHSKQIEQTTSYIPCRSSIETIEVDPRDWSKILEDKRKSPRTAPGATAVVPLFIPREQRSVFYVDPDLSRPGTTTLKKEGDALLNHSKLDHMNLNEEHQKSLLTERRSELDSRQSTDMISKDVLQRVTAPNVHRINQPPLYKQYEQYESNLNDAIHQQQGYQPKGGAQSQGIIDSEAEMVESSTLKLNRNCNQSESQKETEHNKAMATTAAMLEEQEVKMANELRQQTMDNIIRETIDNMDDIRAQLGGAQVNDDEFISYVTELIVQRISEQMDLSSIVAASKSETNASSNMQIPEFLQKAVASQRSTTGASEATIGTKGTDNTNMTNVTVTKPEAIQKPVARKSILTATSVHKQQPQLQAPPTKIHQNTMAELHRGRELTSSDLIGNEPLTQGARANQTSIGTALLSVKMSGLKQRLTPSSTATAAIDPYNTNQPHSQIIPTKLFGPNIVTPARPPAPSTLVPDVIQGNTASYQFQSVQQGQGTVQGQEQQTQSNGQHQVHSVQPTVGGTPALTTQQSNASASMNAAGTAMSGQQPMTGQHAQGQLTQQQLAQQQMMYAQPPPMMISPSMQMQQMGGYPMYPMHYPMQSPYPYPFPYGQPMAPPQDGKARRHTMPQQMAHPVRDDISEDTMSIASRRSGTGKSRKSKKKKRSRSTPSGRDLSSRGDEEERNAAEVKDLFTKAINNRQSAVEELLAQNVDPNTKDDHGNTILHVASQNGNKRLIKVALRWGANINEQNKQGQTALHYLFAYKYENLAAYLISKGADDTLQNEFGYTCYDGLRPAGDE